jgi:hypothetical protein
MPKIKAYKHRGAIIPLDKAKVSTAYLCRWTGSLFATKAAFVKHLSDIRQNRIHANIRKNVLLKKHKSLLNKQWFDGIIDWIETNPEFFLDFTKHRLRHGIAFNKIHPQFWIRINFLKLQYSEYVSNSHARPLNGVSNWGGTALLPDGSPAPRSYPGFQGRIGYQLSHDIGFGSDVFKNTGINTGGGGGAGKNNYEYEVKFFLDDWPELKAMLKKQEDAHYDANFVDMLKNRVNIYNMPAFEYTHGSRVAEKEF